MATKIFYLAAGNDGNFGALVDTVTQAAASRADGWTVGKIAAGNASDLDIGVKQATGTFATASGKPSSLLTGTTANAFKTPDALTGTFAADVWQMRVACRATVASGQVGRIRFRVFQSVNASGASATELTSAAQVGGSSAAGSTTVDSASSLTTWNPGIVTLTNEYLFFVFAWEIVTASGSNTADFLLRTGSGPSTGTRVWTPEWTPGASGTAHTATPADTLVLGDLLERLRTSARTPADTVALADSVKRQKVIPAVFTRSLDLRL